MSSTWELARSNWLAEGEELVTGSKETVGSVKTGNMNTQRTCTSRVCSAFFNFDVNCKSQRCKSYYNDKSTLFNNYIMSSKFL